MMPPPPPHPPPPLVFLVLFLVLCSEGHCSKMMVGVPSPPPASSSGFSTSVPPQQAYDRSVEDERGRHVHHTASGGNADNSASPFKFPPKTKKTDFMYYSGPSTRHNQFGLYQKMIHP
eukprot:TRINITY_DN33898_c0_g1_i1.p1 TRINITY_DN33898_c0_g1~~TRINITY_DN33898_c0_g1_i1.p1  ORF type:complete len:118 (+),score=31.99 TRINITY_DN33898_c0_g1_i1:77-430(+)